MPPTITLNTPPDAVPVTTPRTVEVHPDTTPSSVLSESSELSEFSESSEFSKPSESPDNPTPSLPPLHPLSTSYNQDNSTHSPVNVPSRSRLHFTASVGASTLSKTSSGMNDPNLTGLNSTTNNISITPTNAYSANVGVAYTVASYSRSHLDVGISLSGYSQQGNLHIHDEQHLYVSAMESNSFSAHDEHGMTTIPNNTDEYYTFNTLSLYASVPLSLSLHPRRYNKAGWQLSLTPAHNLVATRHVGHFSATALNSWKLTVGIGVALPNSVIRHISLTANLLPLYTSASLHEFGIEFGI